MTSTNYVKVLKVRDTFILSLLHHNSVSDTELDVFQKS